MKQQASTIIQFFTSISIHLKHFMFYKTLETDKRPLLMFIKQVYWQKKGECKVTKIKVKLTIYNRNPTQTQYPSFIH